MRVRVYRNLLRDDYSVVDAKTNRVVQHLDRLVIRDAQFVVRPGGRARVLRERRKNVHAFVVGEMIPYADMIAGGYAHVTYNPYRIGSFYLKGDGKPVTRARCVILDEGGMRVTGEV